MNRQLITFLLEALSAGLMIYSAQHPDGGNITAALWLALWKSSQAVARAAGTLGMRAELRYFQTVHI